MKTKLRTGFDCLRIGADGTGGAFHDGFPRHGVPKLATRCWAGWVLADAPGDIDHSGMRRSRRISSQMITISHGDADVHGTDLSVALFDIDAFNAGIAGKFPLPRP